MGLLDKRNPRATRRSVIAWAVGMAIVFFVIGLVAWLRTDMPPVSGFFVLPWMTLCGAVAGGAMEWQMPYESDEREGKPDLSPKDRGD